MNCATDTGKLPVNATVSGTLPDDGVAVSVAPVFGGTQLAYWYCAPPLRVPLVHSLDWEIEEQLVEVRAE